MINETEARRLELCDKLNQMGVSLTTEGEKRNDFTIRQMGAILILLSALILDENDMLFFSQICSMYSTQKMIQSMAIEDNIELADFVKKLINRNNPTPSSDDTNLMRP